MLRGKVKIVFLCLIAICVVFLTSCSGNVHKKITQLSDAVLKISVFDENGQLISEGSGFCVYDSETLITNYHVIENGYKVTATSEDNIEYNLSGVCCYDKQRDIAVLKFDNKTNLPVLKMESQYEIGQEVFAIGSPLGLKNTISNGIISGEREVNGYKDLQISAPISHGSSGGVLLNTKGKVLGITYAGIEEGQNLNFAIPTMYFKDLDFDVNKIETFSDIVSNNNPLGNLIENFNGNSDRIPFVSEYVYNNQMYFITKYRAILPHGSQEIAWGLNISSQDKQFRKPLIGCKSPNVYHSKLYCYKYDVNSGDVIISIDLKKFITGEDGYESVVVNLSDLKLKSLSALLVSDYGMYIRSDDTIVHTDINGKEINRISEAGIHWSTLTNDYILAYSTDESNFIKTIDLKTFEKQTINTGIEFAGIRGYTDGIYFLETKNHEGIYRATTIYDPTTSECSVLFEDAGTEIYMYNNYVVTSFPDGTYRKSPWGSTLPNYVLYSINIETGERFKIPLNDSYEVNFGKGNKMYILGKQYASSSETIYRMNLDGSELEEIVSSVIEQ